MNDALKPFSLVVNDQCPKKLLTIKPVCILYSGLDIIPFRFTFLEELSEVEPSQEVLLVLVVLPLLFV